MVDNDGLESYLVSDIVTDCLLVRNPYVLRCVCIFYRAHVVIQVLRVPESTPPLPKDVKDMIDRRIEIINNKEELVSVLNPVTFVDVLLLPGCRNWVNLSLCDR